MRTLTLGELVQVAARTSQVSGAEIVDTMDLTIAAWVNDRSRLCSRREDAAAELLVGVAASRPFATGNLAIAWCLAAQVIALNGGHLDVDPAAAFEIVDGAARGDINELEAANLIACVAVGRQGRFRRMLGTLMHMPEPEVVTWLCPVCNRAVPEPAGRSSVFLSDPLPRDVILDCSRRHLAHLPDGRATAANQPISGEIPAWRLGQLSRWATLQRA